MKTLKNKPLADLPKHVVVGRQRFFYVDSVRQVMQDHTRAPFRRRSIQPERRQARIERKQGQVAP